MNSPVFGKHHRSGSIAATLIVIAGAGCAVAGALSLWAAINDPPKPGSGDPPLWFFLVAAAGSIAFAIRAIADRARIAWALLALLASVLSLLTFWTFGLLSAG